MSTHSSVCAHVHDVQDFTASDVNERLLAAKEQCRSSGARFTPLRQQIYQLVLEANKPVGAYDLITQLQQMRLAEPEAESDSSSHQANTQTPKNVAPPTVYRSLEFLLSEGLIHQLSSMNAYVPCCHPRAAHAAAFLICQKCEKVEECSNIPVDEIMNFATNDAKFTVERSVIELKGICRDCNTQ